MNTRNNIIRESERGMESVLAVLAHANLPIFSMDSDQMIDTSRNISALCAHSFDKPYRGYGVRCCSKCGGLQTN